MTIQFNDKLLSNQNIARILIDHIVADKETQKILSDANQNIEKNNQREKLYTLYNKEYERLKKLGISQFHFHLANGESFLRFHKPKKFGDSLLFRKSIVKIMKTQQEVSGFEVGRYFEGFRYIFPVFFENMYVGSVETTFNAESIMNQMRATLTGNFSMILSKKHLNNRAEKKYITNNYHPFCVDKNYYMANILHDDELLATTALEKLRSEINDNLKVSIPFALSAHDKNDNVKIFTFIPIKGIDEQNLGYILSINDNSTIHNLAMFHILKFFISLIIIVTLYILYMKMREKSKEVAQLFSAIDKTTLISKTDSKGKITFVSDSFIKISGYTKEELMGKNHNIVRDPSMPKEVFAELWSTIKSGKIWNGIVTNRKKDGSQYIVNATILPLLDNNNKVKEYIAIRHDITELEEYKKLLRNKLDEYSELIDRYVIISSTDLKGYITFASGAFANISGYSKEELIGSNHNIVRHPDMDAKIFKEIWKTISSGGKWKGEVKNRKKDGSHYWVYAIISPKFNASNEIIGYTAVRQDISDKKMIEDISQKDKLTQIYNRVKLDDVLLAEMERNNRYQTNFSVILLDIDRFKSVNDTYGHPAGDSVLKETAQILKDSIRKTDTLGRWGGEEFMIICANTELEGALNLAEHLREKIENHTYNVVKNITGSFGVTMYKSQELEETMINRCDKALYISKQEGRNRVSYLKEDNENVKG